MPKITSSHSGWAARFFATTLKSSGGSYSMGRLRNQVAAALVVMVALACLLVMARGADAAATGTNATNSLLRGERSVRHRGLVVGTPTGGGKYPFLVVVRWQDGVQDPRVSCQLDNWRRLRNKERHSPSCCSVGVSFVSQTTQDIWCHGTMVAADVVLVSQSCQPGTCAGGSKRGGLSGEVHGRAARQLPTLSRTWTYTLRGACPPPTDNGYVMVGDSYNNESIQFRRALVRDRDGIVSHPGGRHFLFKIEPVTFLGFYPASINKDPEGVRVGQDVTVVGYGRTHPTNESSFPGEAYEAQLEVVDRWDDAFVTHFPGLGPCGGAWRWSECLDFFRRTDSVFLEIYLMQVTGARRRWMFPAHSSASPFTPVRFQSD
jgi:hypothetical protein